MNSTLARSERGRAPNTARPSSRFLVRLTGPIGALLILGSYPAAAFAANQAGQRAQAHFYAAERQFKGGHFRQALAGYRRAYALRPLPGLLFNIAQCYRNLGRCGQAVRYYRGFIAHAPQSPFADDVRAIIARCNRQPLASASALVPATPPTPARPAVVPDADDPADRRRPSTVSDATISRQPEVTMKRPAPDRRLFWSGVALTGALATAATITWALALHQNEHYKDPGTNPDDRPALRDSGENLILASNLLWGATAASAAATALIYWLHGDRKQPVTTAVSLDTHRLVLGVGGRF